MYTCACVCVLCCSGNHIGSIRVGRTSMLYERNMIYLWLLGGCFGGTCIYKHTHALHNIGSVSRSLASSLAQWLSFSTPHCRCQRRPDRRAYLRTRGSPPKLVKCTPCHKINTHSHTRTHTHDSQPQHIPLLRLCVRVCVCLCRPAPSETLGRNVPTHTRNHIFQLELILTK